MNTMEFQAEFLQRATLPKCEPTLLVIDEYVSLRKSTVHSAIGMGIGSDGISDVKQKLAKGFVRRWMMLRFAALDLSFTSRQWFVKIVRDPSGVRIAGCSDMDMTNGAEDDAICLVASIPRFFGMSVDAKEFACEGKSLHDKASHAAGEMKAGRRKTESYRSVRLTLHAALPDGINDRHVSLASSAMGHLHAASALLFSRGISLFDDLRVSDYRNSELKPTIRILWAPNADALSVTASPPRPIGDPAVLFCVAGHAFLLDFYDTPDEQPIETLIREFSEGRLSN